MVESQFLGVLRIWAAAAWADGVISPNEAAAIRRLISAGSFSEEEQKIALGFLEQKVEIDAGQLSELGADAKEGIYRAACRMATVDREFAAAERAFLDRLRGHLALRADQAGEVEAAILKGVKTR